ncbi:MAG: DNA topoisomerase IB [Planctomycetia bacterium]|nr:DNA topoisomerase IB [Planctomycetia bacterium]
MSKGHRRALDPAVAAAHDASLRYASDDKQGITRHRAGNGFRYLGPTGRTLRNAETLARIRALVIPPAWKDVWICPWPNGHLQATGRDARGRKQYRYHERWRTFRDEEKYGRMLLFAATLPRIRRRVAHDLARRGIPRERVLATIVRLLETSRIRVGNEEYAQENDSYGLTTFRDRHASVRGDRIQFEFRGKSGVMHSIEVEDRRLAKIVKRCRDLPGYELFQYLDEQVERRSIDSSDVNDYLREISGQDFTAKDFRTWSGSLLAAAALTRQATPPSKTGVRRALAAAVKEVAESLGNTPSVCRKCYIHPAVIEAYEDGSLLPLLRPKSKAKNGASRAGLRQDEKRLIHLLQLSLRPAKNRSQAG